MSAALKSVAVVSGLALTGAAITHTAKRSNTDFSRAALASDYDADAKLSAPKPKLPSNFFSFTIGGYEFKNSS